MKGRKRCCPREPENPLPQTKKEKKKGKSEKGEERERKETFTRPHSSSAPSS
jgi:hypothetical protein